MTFYTRVYIVEVI